MYCGSNKTAMASQQQISGAMMRLMQQKPFAQITISELCREAGISRQTFYTLFSSRENVMVFTLQARYCDAPHIEPPDPSAEADSALRRLCHGYSEYLQKNQRLIKTLVDNHIDYLLYDSFYGALENCACFLGDLDPCTRRYAVDFYAGGISSVARRYALEDCSTSADRLEELLIKLFSGRLFWDI